MMVKLALNSGADQPGRRRRARMVSTVFDGISRHTTEGYAFQQRAAEVGFRQAVRERDAEPVRRRRPVDAQGLRGPTWPTDGPRRCRSGSTRPARRIVAAAHALIAEQGYAGCSVALVADGAGVATGSVYRHFPDKGALFAEVFRTATQREVDAVAEAGSKPGSDRRSGSRRAVETFAAPGPQVAAARLRADRRAGRPPGRGRAPRLPPRLPRHLRPGDRRRGRRRRAAGRRTPRSRRRPSSAPWPRPSSSPSTPGWPRSRTVPELSAFVVRSLGATHAHS